MDYPPANAEFLSSWLSFSLGLDCISHKSIMSAKSVKGPGGKKPASAATNLIGIVRTFIGLGQRLISPNSWRWGWHDGGSCLPSFRSEILRVSFLTPTSLLISSADTIKVRMQLSRRKRAPGVSVFTLALVATTELWVDKTSRLFNNWERDCEAGNSSGSVQRFRCGHYRHSAKNGHSVYIL